MADINRCRQVGAAAVYFGREELLRLSTRAQKAVATLFTGVLDSAKGKGGSKGKGGGKGKAIPDRYELQPKYKAAIDKLFPAILSSTAKDAKGKLLTIKAIDITEDDRDRDGVIIGSVVSDLIALLRKGVDLFKTQPKQTMVTEEGEEGEEGEDNATTGLDWTGDAQDVASAVLKGIATMKDPGSLFRSFGRSAEIRVEYLTGLISAMGDSKRTKDLMAIVAVAEHCLETIHKNAAPNGHQGNGQQQSNGQQQNKPQTAAAAS